MLEVFAILVRELIKKHLAKIMIFNRTFNWIVNWILNWISDWIGSLGIGLSFRKHSEAWLWIWKAFRGSYAKNILSHQHIFVCKHDTFSTCVWQSVLIVSSRWLSVCHAVVSCSLRCISARFDVMLFRERKQCVWQTVKVKPKITVTTVGWFHGFWPNHYFTFVCFCP